MYFTRLFQMCRLGSTDDQNYFLTLFTALCQLLRVMCHHTPYEFNRVILSWPNYPNLIRYQSQRMSDGDNCNFASHSVKDSIPDASVLIDQGDNKSS
jgi:hypothetical protein